MCNGQWLYPWGFEALPPRNAPNNRLFQHFHSFNTPWNYHFRPENRPGPKRKFIFQWFSGANMLVSCTPPQTNIAPEHGWLEYDRFLLGMHIFRCEKLPSSIFLSPPQRTCCISGRSIGNSDAGIPWWWGLGWFSWLEAPNCSFGCFKIWSKRSLLMGGIFAKMIYAKMCVFICIYLQRSKLCSLFRQPGNPAKWRGSFPYKWVMTTYDDQPHITRKKCQCKS